MNIILILLVFGIIIAVHELGHFILAKMNKIGVTEFSIGMGPTIWSFQKKETKYSLRLFPIGGFCLMLGDGEDSEAENAFPNKSVWARMLVIAAGPLFNFILAFVFSVVLISFVGYDAPKIDTVNKDSSAYEAGIKKGDVITGIGNEQIKVYREVLVFMQFHQEEKPINLTVERDGKEISFVVTPKLNEEYGIYQIGIIGGYREDGNIFTTVKYSVYEVRYWIKTTIVSLKQLVTGHVKMKNLAGPVGIGKMMSDTIDEADEAGGTIDVVLNVINFCILLSANLGVMNLLPIPALDGGRLLFLVIEAVRRKKISEDKEAFFQIIGFVLMILLMIFVFLNDIKNVFLK